MATVIALSNSATPDPNTCAYCQHPYTPRRRWVQKYCGSACRVAASNERTGRAHPLESKKVRARRRAKGFGRTPSAVAASGGSGAGLTFQQTALAAGVGALGANAISQSAEYLAVTQNLVAQVQQLTQTVAHLLERQKRFEAAQRQQFTTLGNGLFATLQKLGLSSPEVRRVMQLPAPAPVAPPATSPMVPPSATPTPAAEETIPPLGESES